MLYEICSSKVKCTEFTFSLHLDRSKIIFFSVPLKVIFDVPYIHLMYSIPLSFLLSLCFSLRKKNVIILQCPGALHCELGFLVLL